MLLSPVLGAQRREAKEREGKGTREHATIMQPLPKNGTILIKIISKYNLFKFQQLKLLKYLFTLPELRMFIWSIAFGFNVCAQHTIYHFICTVIRSFGEPVVLNDMKVLNMLSWQRQLIKFHFKFESNKQTCVIWWRREKKNRINRHSNTAFPFKRVFVVFVYFLKFFFSFCRTKVSLLIF